MNHASFTPTNLEKHSPALVFPVTILPPTTHMRVPSPVPASTVFGQWAHSLHVAGCMATVSEGQAELVLRLAGPAGQGHSLGLKGDLFPGVAVRRPEAAEMAGGQGDDRHCDEEAGVVFFYGDIQVLHVWRIAQ